MTLFKKNKNALSVDELVLKKRLPSLSIKLQFTILRNDQIVISKTSPFGSNRLPINAQLWYVEVDEAIAPPVLSFDKA